MACGAALRITQYLGNSSLWIDEAALAHNILSRPSAGLFQPLDYAQVAPAGMLLAEKAIVSVAGNSEFALRFFPFACGLASLLLFRKVVYEVLTGWTATYAVGLFSLGVPFIYFSSQLKQYSSDVTTVLVLLLAAPQLRDGEQTSGRTGLLAGAGAIACWFSHAAIVMVAAIGLASLVLASLERNRASRKRLSIVLAMWAISAAAAAAHALTSVTDANREYLRSFWRAGLMPLPPRSADDWLWIPQRLNLLFGAFQEGVGPTNGGLGYRWSVLFTVVMLVGIWTLRRRRRDMALFLLLPLILVLLLSAVGIYPFSARLILFTLPLLLIATAAGAQYVLEAWPRRLSFLSPAALAILGGAPLFAIAAALPPVKFEHLRPIVEYVRQSGRPDDTVFVYHGAALSFRYYAARLGIDPHRVVLGRCQLSLRGYLHELDRVRGRDRVWVLMTHVRTTARRELLVRYLDQIGRRLDGLVIPGTSGGEPSNAYGYLYDLTGPSAVRAETYGPLPHEAPSSRWSCYGVNSDAASASSPSFPSP